MLDIQNTFNTAPWEKISEAMANKSLPSYICRLINNYLSDRTLHYQQADGKQTAMKISCGVPQGSVLGPTLWNIMYDDLLRTRLQEGARYLAFADDIAIIARDRDTMQLQRILTSAVEDTTSWLQRAGLQLAAHKTEVMVISDA